MRKKKGFFDEPSLEVKTFNADELLEKNMTEYAKDVVEDRALSDYRDGLKPSMRRLLWATHELKAHSNSKTVKSARIVGDTMGKYHPHGNTGIYGSLVTMVDAEYPIFYGGQGNWGSLTDCAAAERYTETKLSDIGMKMLECNVVMDSVPNYTGEFQEPLILPTRFPYFFVNDCFGVGVGLSCNIPSHNLEEMVNAFKVVVKKGKNTKTKDILKHIKGPDYSYGGKLLSDKATLEEFYENGGGTLQYECKYKIEDDNNGYLVTIYEYCPGFNPKSFIENMNKLAKESKIFDVNDATTKNDKCKIEITIKNKEDFDLYIKKEIQIKNSYRYFAIKRSLAKDIEHDVSVEIIEPKLVTLMINWIDWRKDVETKMIKNELLILDTKKFRAELRMEASKHLNIVMTSLEQDDPIKHLMDNLPYLKKMKDRVKAKEGAIYIGEQRVISLKKVDQVKTQKDIDSIDLDIKSLNKDLNDIDSVVIRELNNLKSFYKDRKLEI